MRLQEVITSIIAIMGGIAMACKTVAELWKKVPAGICMPVLPFAANCALIVPVADAEEEVKRRAHPAQP
jgi:hypothetical protein